jgi:hypothetical protein
MKSLLTPQLLDHLYSWLTECAADGRVCPGNTEIAKRYEFSSVATAAKAVGRLEEQGRIAVLRGWTARQVTINASGESTAQIRQTTRVVRKPPQPTDRIVDVFSGPRVVGPRGRQCQWIEGEPSGDDSCKCLRETALGVSWCPTHQTRIFLPPEVADQRFGPLRGLVREKVVRRIAK